MTITDFIGGGYKEMLGKETPEEKKENDETDRIMSLCPTCNGTKKVGGVVEIDGDDNAEVEIPCPDCQKEFYE